jgi:integrase
MTKLTKPFIDSIQADPVRDLVHWDDKLPCFGIRTKPTGVKSFIVQYRNKNGRSRRFTVGRFGTLTFEQGRAQAKVILADVARGLDPAEQRTADRDAVTIEMLCHEYLQRAEKGLIITRRKRTKKPSTLYVDRGRIQRHIIPLLGRRTVKDLTQADLRAFLRDVIAGKTAADVKTKKFGRSIVKGGRGTASRTLGLLGGILTYAVEEGYRHDNPMRGVIRPQDERRDLHLDMEGYQLLGKKLEAAEQNGESWQAVQAIRALALTGCRRGEIENLKGAEIDFKAGALRLGDSKTGRSTRPAGSVALDLLRQAAAKSDGPFVFSSERRPGAAFSGLPKAWRRIMGKELAWLTPHGLRHSFASIAEDLGFTLPTIGSLLGHSSHGVTAGYVHKVDQVLVASANSVAEHIARAMRGERAASVVPLPSAHSHIANRST